MATLREALVTEAASVAEYLDRRLGARRVRPDLFQRLFAYGWMPEKPNLGYLIESEGRVRGFVGGIYSLRDIGGHQHSFCNIHSFAVDEECRHLSLRLLKCLLDRPDYTYTCVSASPAVVDILRFFRFQSLDATKVLLTPAAGLPGLARPAVRLYRGAALAATLDPAERAILRDHAGYRCGHFVLEAAGERCYFVTVRRGRGIRAYADVLHASRPALLVDQVARAHVPVALAHRTPLIGLDRRLVPQRPAGSFVYSRVRPVMFRSPTLGAGHIDTLYSELVPMYG